jgi:hypothetical protein
MIVSRKTVSLAVTMIILHCKHAVILDADKLQGEAGGSTELLLVRLNVLTRHQLTESTRVAV